ncbi:DNA-3-methyladenine glycosylase family protein [Clostridium senegalense]|uniref:DNA-3-methyladenine glycosylase family protein n=1 Tax=Clostridium senegalense TaxID=1465809 RepID=UPI00028848FC|nr:DNA-3-methyladenine glycosylase [Clostridium senegalense]MBU5226048.1 DNA-3-methyladenine glycosylase [Clostridium senegalense]
MDFKEVLEFDNKIVLKDVENFELKDIFDCGQCFRWNKTKDNTYIGVAYNKVIEIEKEGNNVIIHNSNLKDFNEIWCEYFDLKRNYSKIKEELKKDPILDTAVAFGEGIRILKQEPFEILISFIVSANNRIPMIKRAINNISKKYGNELEYKGEKYYSFPSVDRLIEASQEEIEEMGVGFRAKYIVDSVDKVYNNVYNLEEIKSMDDDECHEGLKQFNGVGPKVADCIMLFSMQKYSSFPVDVWVKRAMQHFYVAPDVSLPKIRMFARDKFGNLAGFAQQYLFFYARENKII